MSRTKDRSNSDMHPADIRAAIAKKGTTLAELSRHHGYVSATPFYNALRMPYPKIERIIADFLDTTPDTLWPTRYQKPVIDFKTGPNTSTAI